LCWRRWRCRSLSEFHLWSFLLLDCDEFPLRLLVRGTAYRDENEHGGDRRERRNRDPPSSIPRDLGCRIRLACALVGASDIREHDLASHAIGKMRFETFTFRRGYRPVAVGRYRFRVSALGRRRTGLRAHRTAQDRVERLIILVSRRHVLTSP
jgi:hypothetical protein